MAMLPRITVLTVFALMALGARADTLLLTDGREFSGQYEGGDARIVRFRSGDHAGLLVTFNGLP